MQRYDLLTVLGPTACGKTALAVKLARRIGGEIISADSRQVYRRMDIGTGKDLAEYTLDGKPVAYHLIDIVEPGTKYNVFRYQQDFLAAYHTIREKGHRAIVCGGSGLYLESILRGYALPPVPENKELREALSNKSLSELTAILGQYKQLHNTTDVDTCQRAIRAIEIAEFSRTHSQQTPPFPKLSAYVIGLQVDRDTRRQRITQRLQQRLAGGLIGEVEALLSEGIAAEDLLYYGLEYKYVTLYVLGRLTYDEMFSQLEIAIHQFAKRQMTWFRGMERRGVPIHWMSATEALELTGF